MHRAPDAAATSGRAPHHLAEQSVELQAPRDRMPVAAIRDGEVVVGPEHGDGSDGHRFLALAQMRGPLDHALLEELLDLVLEQADLDHPAVPGELLI